MQTHETEKMIQCQFCDKKFSQTNNLKRHVQRHETERKYKCQKCVRKFSTSDCLKDIC